MRYKDTGYKYGQLEVWSYLGHGLLGLLHIKIRENKFGGLGCFPFSRDAFDPTRHKGGFRRGRTRGLFLHDLGSGETINILEIKAGTWFTGTCHPKIQGVILVLIYLYLAYPESTLWILYLSCLFWIQKGPHSHKFLECEDEKSGRDPRKLAGHQFLLHCRLVGARSRQTWRL